MMNNGVEQKAVTPQNLQRNFEHAVRDIYEASSTGKISDYRRPIAQRLGTGRPSSAAEVEKRALADAAKALAQLWKVSPSPSR